MTPTLAAVALSMLSAGSYAAAAVVQERLAAAGHRGWTRWCAALLLTGAGAGLHVVALAYGTVGVVQALGTLTLLFALPVAAVRNRTPISPAAWRDAGLTIAGIATVMALAVPGTTSAPTGDAARHLVLAAAGAVAVLTCLAWQSGSPSARALLLAAGSGVAFAVASVFSKVLLGSLTVSAAVAVAVFATAGYLLGQLSYRGAGLAGPLAMVSVSNPVVAAVVGVAVLGESFRYGVAGVVAVAVAGAVAAVGVIGLARARRTVAAAPRPAEHALAA